MLRKYFKHDVSCVESGEKALNLLSKEHFNLVFMDVDMPNLTGIETTLAIRNSDTILKENVHVPVIAYTTNQWDNEYSKAGMIGYVGKPANPSKIQAELEKPLRPTTELFKLHLAKMTDKPPLPDKLHHKQAITDYLSQLNKSIKETIDSRWQNIDFFDNVLLILTIPAEFDDSAIATLRESEAAAIYCMKVLKEHKLEVGASFMVVDCGGGTVDLTTRELLDDEKLSEITIRSGDFCGGSYVDKEFIKFVSEKVGENAMEIIIQDHYSQLQYMVQDFCRKAKLPFTGNMLEYETYELDIEELCPSIKQYIIDEEKIEELVDCEWLIELTFEDVKAMFDPVIEKIIKLINRQLDSNKGNECSAMFLVGGFSESKYLQSVIRREFSSRVKNISVPSHPMAAIIRGAVMFGLRKEVIVDRKLKWNYGTDVVRPWESTDPMDRRLPNGLIKVLNILAEKGTKVNVDESITTVYVPYSLSQRKMNLDLYKTDKNDAQYCDEDDDVELMGKFVADLPRTGDYNDRTILLTLTFGTVEIQANAKSKLTGDEFNTTFELDL
ncbi:21727_t:CDS:2 [Entrophospora sp. SA101]|nr:21727_t:CDS:2 [Entrophospora sp. SA101]